MVRKSFHACFALLVCLCFASTTVHVAAMEAQTVELQLTITLEELAEYQAGRQEESGQGDEPKENEDADKNAENKGETVRSLLPKAGERRTSRRLIAIGGVVLLLTAGIYWQNRRKENQKNRN